MLQTDIRLVAWPIKISLILVAVSLVTFASGSRTVIADNCVNSFCINIGTDSVQTNNCRDTGQCSNFGDQNVQINNCVQSRSCENGGKNHDSTESNFCVDVGAESRRGIGCINNGDMSTQTNICVHVTLSSFKAPGCGNLGSESTQTNICSNGPCLNSGDSSAQTNICHKTSCKTSSSPSTPNRQITICNSAGECTNSGDHTIVIAKGTNCSSGSPNSITICQPTKTLVVP